MRVFLTPIGSAGDNLPFIGLGRELRRRGHDVTVFSSAPFMDLIRTCGLDYVEIVSAAEYAEATLNANLFDSRRGFATVMSFVREQLRRLFEALTSRLEPGNTLIVAHGLDFAARIIQDGTGTPVVTVHLAPAVIRSLHHMPVMKGTVDWSFLPHWVKRAAWWLLDRTLIDPELAPVINELRRRYDLPSVHRIFADWIHSPLLTVAMFPPWFAAPQPDWPPQLRLTSFPLFDGLEPQGVPPDVEAFLDEGTAPLVFTPGSANRFASEFFSAALSACERLNRRGLLLTGHSEHIPPTMPAGVLHARYAPLSRILPRCSALVHHGGIGTTAAGLAGGVPQVIMPMSHDQPDNAARVVALGAGARLMPRRFNTDTLAAATSSLLHAEDVLQRCRQLRERLRSVDGISLTCDRIESVLANTVEAGAQQRRRIAGV